MREFKTETVLNRRFPYRILFRDIQVNTNASHTVGKWRRLSQHTSIDAANFAWAFVHAYGRAPNASEAAKHWSDTHHGHTLKQT